MAGRRLPSALTIAGSDSGGGAGIQADLKTFAALEVHGTSVITCLTAQNPRETLAIEPVRTGMVALQLEAVFAELPPSAAKTGMLYSRLVIEVVAEFLQEHRAVPVVVDPVMVSTAGARLLRTQAALQALESRLLPLARLVTPNLDEARILAGVDVLEPEDLRRAARVLRDRYGCAALVKGGHLDAREAVDVFWDGRNEMLLRAPRIRAVSPHGTGCTYAAAIAAYLAKGMPLIRAVEYAKGYITRAIAGSGRVGVHSVLATAGRA